MNTERFFALLVGLLAIAALVAQFIVSGETPHLVPWSARIWSLVSFFTILTNVLVAAHMIAIAANRPRAGWTSASVTLSIVMVGIIYHVLLAKPGSLHGTGFWADFGLHTAVPVAMAAWWLAYAPKDMALRTLPLWLIWPFLYCIYAMIRGQFTGVYPYFFIDVAQFGFGAIALNIVGLIACFAAMGLVLWVIARLMLRSAVR